MKTAKRQHDSLRQGDFVKHSKGWYMVIRPMSRAANCTTYHVVFADGTQNSLIVYGVVDTAPQTEVPDSFKPGAMRARAAKIQRQVDGLRAQAELLMRMANRTDLPPQTM